MAQPFTQTPQQTQSVGALMSPQAPPPSPPKTPQEKESLTADWLKFLQRTETRAGLVQFMIDSMQPLAPGQTKTGAFGRNLAGAGQAIGRVRTSRREREEQKRKAGLEERRVSVAEEGPKLRREEITSREGIVEKQTGSAEGIAREARTARADIQKTGLDAHMTRLKFELDKRDQTTRTASETSMLTMILKQDADQYKACVQGSLSGGDECTPPTFGKVLTQFNMFKNVISNKTPIPDDGTIKDEEFVEVLVNGTEQDKAKALQTMQFMEQTQRARIEAEVERRKAGAPESEEAEQERLRLEGNIRAEEIEAEPSVIPDILKPSSQQPKTREQRKRLREQRELRKLRKAIPRL